MSTRRVSKKQETGVAKRLGGKRQSNSGATPFQKGDILTSNFLIEAKTVSRPQKSVTIKKEWIDKAKQEAFSMGRDYSAIAFDFGKNTLGIAEIFYIIDERLFKDLLEIKGEEE